MSEVIEMPLSRALLAQRYRELIADPRFANLPGTLELDQWGAIRMSPASNPHGLAQARLVTLLGSLGSDPLVEASILTASGVLVADVVWCSPDFMECHRHQTPFPSAPELCVEVVSPSNSVKELREKTAAYLDAGAQEVWIVYPESRRVEFFGAEGRLAESRFAVPLDTLFR